MSSKQSYQGIIRSVACGQRVSAECARKEVYAFESNVCPSHILWRLCVVWMLGNLARATYVGSADFIWPFSYNQCDDSILQSQEINACLMVNHYGLNPFQGRGSPEIDIIESMQGNVEEKLPNTWIKRPYQSASLQIAPGLDVDRPTLGHRPKQV